MERKLLIATLLSAGLLLPAFGAPRGDETAVVDVTGEVKLMQANSQRAVADASKVVLWLVPVEGTDHFAGPISAKHHFLMLQHDKTFEPNLLVVPLGSIVDFPNLDPWFHNVFSLYQGKRFDLGLYQAGAEKAVLFDRPGPSFLFCNIHPQMTAVILTVNSALFGISDKNGHVSIHHVPAGRYTLHAWYEDAASNLTDLSQRALDIGPGENVLPVLSITVTKHDHAHKNKYGLDYDPEASAPAY
jgi:plastocyanin